MNATTEPKIAIISPVGTILIGKDEEGNHKTTDRFELGETLTQEQIQSAVEAGTAKLVPPIGRKKKGKTAVKVFLWCGGIADRFKEYLVATPQVALEEQIATVKRRSNKESKAIYVSVLRNLHQWTDEQLHKNYVAKNGAWENWCDDCVLFFAYNHILFNKGIPAVEPPAGY